MSVARTSLALLAIQLVLVSSIAAKYLLDRSISPRVWARAVAYDPSMIMRGRYLSTQLKIDACGINLPIAGNQPPAPEDGRIYFSTNGTGDLTEHVSVIMGTKDGKLVAERIVDSRDGRNGQNIVLHKGQTCSDATLWRPVDFYLSETAKSPFPLRTGQELWVEVTVPSAGPPRPISLAIKSADSQWQPLNYR
jgi:hypothetical protein